MPDPQRAQGVLEFDSALDRDERGDLAERLRLRVVRRPPRRKKDVRVRLLDAPDEIDLLERRPGGMGGPGRLERRPELRPDHSLAQARDVGVGVFVDPVQLVGDHVAARRLVDPDDPGQVVVTVEQGRAAERRARRRQRVVRRSRGRACRFLRHASRPIQFTGSATNRATPSPFETRSSAGFLLLSFFAASIALATSRGVSTA